MGDCQYCKKPAGFFRRKHKECEKINLQGCKEIITEVMQAINAGEDSYDALEKLVSIIAEQSYIPQHERKALFIQGWESSVDHFLEDDFLDKSEETRLVTFQQKFNFSQYDLNKNGQFSRIGKSVILQELCNGIVPQRFKQDGLPAINYQKNEKLVWAFNNVAYLEDKIKREFVGSSQSVSIKIAKGVYYRTGSFKGRPVEHTERVKIDNGWLVITDKNIYFSGPLKSLRVPYPKIIDFDPYSNGIGIKRDAATAKPQIFVTGDGWFTFNLITNLAKL